MSNVRRKLRVWPNDFVSLRNRKEKEQQNNEESDNSSNYDNNNINTNNSNSNSSSRGSSTESNSTNNSDSSAILGNTATTSNKLSVAATKSLDLTGSHDDDIHVAYRNVYKNDDDKNNDEDDEVSG